MKKLIWLFHMWVAEIHADVFVRPSLTVYKVQLTDDDQKVIRLFLNSQAGAKLQDACLAHIQNTDHQAVGISTARACGYAAGQRSMLATLIALSGHVPPQEDDSEEQQLQGMPLHRYPLPETSNEKLEHS